MADIDEAPKLTVADFAGAIFCFNKVAAEALGLAVGLMQCDPRHARAVLRVTDRAAPERVS